jgi:hypothetical protein
VSGVVLDFSIPIQPARNRQPCLAMRILVLMRLNNTPVRLIALTSITFQMLAFLLWLFGKRQLASLSGIFGGILLAGVLISFACGLFLLPLSVIGLVVFLLGLAGFTPFITCHVFYRHFSYAKNAAFSILTATKPGQYA